MSTLHEHRDEFADRNPFLDVVLGLLSVGRAIEALPEVVSTTRSPGEPSDELDPVTSLLLGLASIAVTTRTHAESAALPDAPATPAAAAPGPRSLREYLRR